MTKQDDESFADLDALFAQARDSDAPMRHDFLLHLQDQAAEAVAVKLAPSQVGPWRQVYSWLGGAFGLGGLSVAGLAGFAIGMSGTLSAMQGVDLSTLLQSDLSVYSEQFAGSGYETLLVEDF